jgi:hypothetical protein
MYNHTKVRTLKALFGIVIDLEQTQQGGFTCQVISHVQDVIGHILTHGNPVNPVEDENQATDGAYPADWPDGPDEPKEGPSEPVEGPSEPVADPEEDILEELMSRLIFPRPNPNEVRDHLLDRLKHLAKVMEEGPIEPPVEVPDFVRRSAARHKCNIAKELGIDPSDIKISFHRIA